MAVIGIDLGTTNSLVTVWRDGGYTIIPNSFGEWLTPSCVSVDENGEILVGKIAKERLISHPNKSASSFKQFMGTSKEYILGKKTFYPEDLSSFILRRLREDAEIFLGEKVTEAVISVPAYFNDTQRSATKTAGQLAGLEVNRIINEPSAAALAYQQKLELDGTFLVIDLGGGTLDVSVVDMFANIVDILAVSGDNHLGGDDFNEAILQAFMEENEELKATITPEEYSGLLKSAEECKITLTTLSKAFMIYIKDGKQYSMELDQQKLMTISSALLSRIKKVVLKVLKDCKKPISLFDEVILVGGSCKMPLIQSYVNYLTKKTPQSSINPDHCVAIGTGIVSGIKNRDDGIKDMVLTDLCPFSLGIAIYKTEANRRVFSPIIERNSPLPSSHEDIFYTIEDQQPKVTVTVYQGESIDLEKNLQLCSIVMPVPPLPAGQATITVRFTYDINGILDVEVICNQTGDKRHELIVRNKNLSEEEIAQRVQALAEIKIQPREKDEIRLLIAQGERLYEESSGDLRILIQERLIAFETLLKKNLHQTEIERATIMMRDFFRQIDTNEDEWLLGENSNE